MPPSENRLPWAVISNHSPWDLFPLPVSTTVDIAIGPTDNHSKLDGAVIICFITVGISVDIEFSPNPSMSLVAKVAFAEAVEFDLTAKTAGSFDGNGSSQRDFSLEVEMHQEILQHIIKEAQAHFSAMSDAAQANNADKKKDLDALAATKLQNDEDWVNQKMLLADQKRALLTKLSTITRLVTSKRTRPKRQTFAEPKRKTWGFIISRWHKTKRS